MVELAAQQPASGPSQEVMRAMDLTRSARMAGLRGNFAKGYELLDEAEQLSAQDNLRVKISVALERGRLTNTGGNAAGSIPFFLTAWTLAENGGAHVLDLGVDALHMLAIVETVDKAEIWTEKALQIVAGSTDGRITGWQGPLVNNIGWSNFDAGRFERAFELFSRDAAYREANGRARETRIARYGMARTLRAMGRVEEALVLNLQLVKDAEAIGDEPSYVFEELAECYSIKGDTPQATISAVRALKSLRDDPDFVRDEPERLRRLEELAAK